MSFIGLIFSIFTGPLGKIASYTLLISGLIAAGWTFWTVHNDNVANAARAAFNAQQLAIVQKENADYATKLAQITADEQNLNAQLAADTLELASQTQETVKWVSTQKTGTLDPIYNATLQHIKSKHKKATKKK